MLFLLMASVHISVTLPLEAVVCKNINTLIMILMVKCYFYPSSFMWLVVPSAKNTSNNNNSDNKVWFLFFPDFLWCVSPLRYLTIGISSVWRKDDYLTHTIDSILKETTEDEKADIYIFLLLADADATLRWLNDAIWLSFLPFFYSFSHPCLFFSCNVFLSLIAYGSFSLLMMSFFSAMICVFLFMSF